MSDFHYVRTLGDDGGVDACSGAAIGLDLESVLRDGLPPHNVTLQIIAGLCEILDIAEEDGQVHGDISLTHVFVDDTGAVSLEGFGQRRSRAPEGRPQGSITDLYGLGCAGFELFAGHPLPDVNLKYRDDHDDDVIDAILAIQFGDLNEELVGDVQWFLAKLLSFNPDERPNAVETWRTFVAFAEEARGPEFIGWCLDALEGGGERRRPDGSVIANQAAPAEPAAQALDGPILSRGPLEKGGMAFSTANVAGGTAFFTKADMKAALAKSPDSPKDRQPAAGGGTATNYWSRDQLKAMAAGDQEAPRPKRAAGEGQRRRTMATTKADLDEARRREADAVKRIPPAAPPVPLPSRPPAPEVSRPPLPGGGMDPQAMSVRPFAGSFSDEAGGGEETVRMTLSSVRTTQTPAPAPQVYRPPNAPPKDEPKPDTAQAPTKQLQDADRVIAQGLKSGTQQPPRVPKAQLPVEPPVPVYEPEDYDEEEEGGNTNVLLFAGILVVVVVAIVLCTGLGGLSALVAVFSGAGSTPTSETPVIEEPVPGLPTTLPSVDPDAPVPANPDTPDPADPAVPAPVRPDPQPTRPTPQPTRPDPQPTRPTPQPTRPEPTRPTPRPQPAEPKELSTSPVTLTMKTKNRGQLTCCGTRKSFDGPVMLNIEAYKLTCTCLVDIDGAKNAFQVQGTGSVTCNKAGSEVNCNKAMVK